jgi:glucokinase
MSEHLVLAGDIGGTKSNLAFFCGAPDAPQAVAERSYRNREFASLADVVRRFLADTGLSAVSACFGVAGAVVDGASVLPNLDWKLSENELAQALGLNAVRLINDLEANALGISTLTSEQFFILNPGQPRPGGNRALIAAGTGLGEAFLFKTDVGYRVSASEGGHVDFAPRGEEQMGLLRYLAARYGHVSYERVLSGPGLANIYGFLRDDRGMEEPAWLAERIHGGEDAAAVIASAGLAREADICVHALDLFMGIYGAAAGNLALKALATNGLYLGGGIAPKLIEKFSESNFMTAFTDKGRFSCLLAEMPVRIILKPNTALRGAATVALDQ